jgi:hypothetical protein
MGFPDDVVVIAWGLSLERFVDFVKFSYPLNLFYIGTRLDPP